MERLGTDPSNLARKAKLAPSTLTRFVRDPHHKLTPASLAAIAKVSRMPLPEDLRQLVDPDFVAAAESEFLDVYALIASHNDGQFFLNQTSHEQVERPASLARRERVFALRMPDDSMSPWRRPNELLFVDPTWAVGEGDHTLVRLKPSGEERNEPLHVIARYAGRTGQRLTFLRYGDDQPLSLHPSEITARMRILEWPEISGLR